MNAEIEFQGISTDFEAMARMEVYTTIITRSFGNQEVQLVNIVHLHFNTASEDTTIEAVYLEGGQTKHDHIEFGTDATGRPLKYKILVRDKHVAMILYNDNNQVQEVPFEEIRMADGDKIEISGHKLGDFPAYGEIEQFPIGMLVCEERYRKFADTIEEKHAESLMMGDCTKRHPEKLPGYIDVLVWSEFVFNDGTASFLPTPMKISAAMCLFKKA